METEQIEKPKRTRTAKPAVQAERAQPWGKSEFYSIAKQFNAETPELQKSLIEISTMLQTIKLNLKEQPLVIIYLVKKAVPELGELAINGNLKLGIDGISQNGVINPGESLAEFLTSFSTFTSDCTDASWNTFWHSMFTAIAAPLVPFSKAVSYSEYVYQMLVKPEVK